ALDLVAPHGVTSSKVTFRQLDVSDPTVVEVLRGIDVVIHLAGRYPAPHDVDDAHRTNVGGACNVATAARVAGVRHLVYVSSVFAYGAHPDNDLPLTEASPLRASPAVPVGAHQREVEEWLAAPAADDGGPTLTILRFAMVL